MNALDKDYKEHKIFTELDYYAEFYDSISMAVMSFVTTGTKSLYNIDTYSFSSIQGTIESIKDTLSKARINDAFALLRKYHDSIIINVYANLYLKDNVSLEKFYVESINNWLDGKAALPRFGAMSKYLKDSDDLDSINNLLFTDDRYKKIRSRCNDHMHSNFFQYVMLNDNQIHNPHRVKWLDRLSIDIRDLFIMHFAYVFSFNDCYMMSSDYIDALDVNMEPEDESQYWVAPFIQEMFDQVFRVHRPDLYEEIKKTSSMQLA